MTFLLSLLSLSSVSFAQDEEPTGPETPVVARDPLEIPMQEIVVVTAHRIKALASQVGSSVTVISGEELHRKQYRFVLDALREVQGIDIRRQGGPGSQTSIFLRGTDSDHTLLLIDGMQLHDVSSPNNTALLDHLRVDNIERIEVVRGPQSTLYGSESIGGVINVITKKGSGKSTLTLSAEGGSFATAIEQFQTSGAAGRIDYSFGLSRLDNDGFSARTNNDEDDAYENTSISGRIGLRGSERFRADLIMLHVDANNEFDAGTDVSLSETNTKESALKVEPHLVLFDGMWEQRLGAWVHDVERKNAGSGFVLPSDFRGQNFGVDWQHNVYPHRHHTLTLGAEFERQETENRVTIFPEIDTDAETLAFFLQDWIQLKDRVSGTLGVRVDDHSDFGSKATYRAAGAYNSQRRGTIVRASAGTGFKAPSLSELFDTSFGSNNPNLEPEESIGFDIGIEQAMMNRTLRFGATYFYNDVDDMIVTVFTGAAFQNTNVEKVVTEGVETFFRVQPSDRFMAQLSYTYTDTEAKEAASFGITEGDQLLRRPLHNVAAEISRRFLRGRGQATVTALYVGERQDLDPNTFATVTANAHMVVNITSSLWLHERLEIFGRVDNLFDEDYEEVLGFQSPSISAYGGLRIGF